MPRGVQLGSGRAGFESIKKTKKSKKTKKACKTNNDLPGSRETQGSETSRRSGTDSAETCTEISRAETRSTSRCGEDTQDEDYVQFPLELGSEMGSEIVSVFY